MNRKTIFTALLLLVAIFNYAMITSSDFSSVEFFSVMAMGMLTGVFLVQIFHKNKNRKRNKTS